MPLRSILGVILFGHAVFVTIQLLMHFDGLEQSAATFAAPGNPFWFLVGLVALNASMILSAVILGGYSIRAKELKCIYVLPLAVVTAFYGGYSLALGASALGVCFRERYRSSDV